MTKETNLTQIYCVNPIKPLGDKQTRLFAQQAVFESGRIKFPQEAYWLVECIRELSAFPYAKHDDQVDAMTQALGFMRERLEEPGLIAYYRLEVERMNRGGLL